MSLHHRMGNQSNEHRFKCPACRRDRPAPSAHMRKLFLVAERLSWEDGLVPNSERELNEELTWEVNYSLGVQDPAVEDPVPGGKQSGANQWHPFENQEDLSATMKFVAKVDRLDERSWSLWSHMIDSLYGDCESQHHSSHSYLGYSKDTVPARLPSIQSSFQPVGDDARAPVRGTGGNFHPLTPPSSLDLHYKSPYALPTSTRSPESSTQPASSHTSTNPRPKKRSLREFYSLLDSIERTSFVGAQYLEAYAELLRDDLCNDCWFRHNVLSEDVLTT